ncbi:bifunctional 2-C-methyl-D-erythritol 4-phosphate cytidylyltransferase/2-C-methyl-D-erythritol 2,4-cyclodiphosphate synthase [Plastoroseomonas arctica]|uniref:Bifunctional enzyme IspD/IspF n=1 Tax=Plastoroseomonas arctica TaxID=1509237 RepID=A0AAF1K097_9PROT|nr:bifunctional 2-C-methyl-D-erythritol 4-phosphate cytidylyltransferase/2-C-methyl-D-erythritol 2,4-cyclodiphosphate synthase [Plastoroseomonas arctica]MBR0653810.1 bifunctional 2-C-methyl-D-erythritol 4-phosphate cytidylyltransferase/2-C-methyl-D-erythritol 2,4-cyclodiphosphate synthase [Plastoroseomonas arctica]
MRIIALLLAAGRGARFGGDTAKQFAQIGDRTVLRHAAEALLAEGLVTALLPVCQPSEQAQVAALLAGLPTLAPMAGGATRQASVRAGLEAMSGDAPDLVLIHDAARPIIPGGTIARLIAELADHPGAIPAQPVSDTLKRAEGGVIAATVPREGLFRAQTPQAFRFAPLLAAHRTAAAEVTDDAALLELMGLVVALVPGSERNIKITHPEDLARVTSLMTPALFPRMGTGFDVHRLVAGRPLVLCGVTVPHALGLDGHSDADVGLHALCDAIYGALAEGDIGRHFPPSEAEWKDADSARFLRHAAARIAARGGVLANADVTLICERPKIAPHAEAMRTRLAELLGAPVSRISVKATTTERLGFTGRGEGIAAQAAAVVLLPD